MLFYWINASSTFPLKKKKKNKQTAQPRLLLLPRNQSPPTQALEDFLFYRKRKKIFGFILLHIFCKEITNPPIEFISHT
jgi:hypothetical protein